MLTAVKTLALAPVLEDLGLKSNRVRTVGDEAAPPHSDAHHAVAGVPPGVNSPDIAAGDVLDLARRHCTGDGCLLVFLEGLRPEAELAHWRNALWPEWHVNALYRLGHNGIFQVTLESTRSLNRGSGLRGVLFVARARKSVFAPEATVEKFDKNSAGWNGEPGTPGYAHFRWMRRFVAGFAQRPDARRILDFGCGAGWVGIEAARLAHGAVLCAFDPSPAMVKLAEENARASGLARFEARTGFGEAPPFPSAGASADEGPFDLVLSSGVISFAQDRPAWLDGLARTVAKGGTLVIGDIQRDSGGMRERRATRALLPLREMNACAHADVRGMLEERGFVHAMTRGYQLTRPMPQLMHFSETRLSGALSRPLLWVNRLASALIGASTSRFDSWVMRFTRS